MHIMTMINEHEGIEEWFCSSCGRHMLVNWIPKFKRTVLLEGDPSARHSGSKGNLLTMDKMDMSVDKSLPLEYPNESKAHTSLIPWLAWMNEVGFENLWNSDAQ